jgi:hypothetical protein
MDAVRALITRRLEEASLTMKDASLRIGRAHSYLYQFLKRGILLEMHEREREKLASILGVSADELRGPQTNGGSPPDNNDTNRSSEDLRELCRHYEAALRSIVEYQAGAAEIARSALRKSKSRL